MPLPYLSLGLTHPERWVTQFCVGKYQNSLQIFHVRPNLYKNVVQKCLLSCPQSPVLAVGFSGSGRHGASWRPEEDFEGKVVQNHVFFCQKLRDRPFRVDGSDPTLTKYHACAQKLAASDPAPTRKRRHPVSNTHRQNPYSVNTVWGLK